MDPDPVFVYKKISDPNPVFRKDGSVNVLSTRVLLQKKSVEIYTYIYTILSKSGVMKYLEGHIKCESGRNPDCLEGSIQRNKINK